MSFFLKNDKKKRKRLARPTKLQIARGQNFICYACKRKISSGDAYDIHHQDHDPSNNNITNLKVMHVKCHRSIKSNPRKRKSGYDVSNIIGLPKFKLWH